MCVPLETEKLAFGLEKAHGHSGRCQQIVFRRPISGLLQPLPELSILHNRPVDSSLHAVCQPECYHSSVVPFMGHDGPLLFLPYLGQTILQITCLYELVKRLGSYFGQGSKFRTNFVCEHRMPVDR